MPDLQSPEERLDLEFDQKGNFQHARLFSKDGEELTLRPSQPEDRDGLEKMFRSCSSETLYTRFLSPGLGVPLRYLDRLLINNPPRTMSMVAVKDEDEECSIVGLMNMVMEKNSPHGELAIVVVDDYQNRGLGSAMLRCLYKIAKNFGLNKFIADVDATNRRVFHLIKRSGLPFETDIHQGVARVEVTM